MVTTNYFIPNSSFVFIPEKYKVLEMCQKTTSISSAHILQASGTVIQRQSTCVCVTTAISSKSVSVSVKNFQCNTNTCPWKLAYYENGCLRNETCCGPKRNDFTYRMPSFGKVMVMHRKELLLSSSFYLSAVTIILIGGEYVDSYQQLLQQHTIIINNNTCNV